MSARINFVIRAFDETVDDLNLTLESISKVDYQNKFSSIITNSSNAETITNILNFKEELIASNRSLDLDFNKVFNKNPYGIPSFCLIFGEGKIRLADALNALVKEIFNHTDLFCFITSGQVVHKDFCNKVIDSVDEFPGITGIVYTDFYYHGLRIYQEPFIKEKIDDKWKPFVYSIPKYIFDRKQFFPLEDNCENKFLLKIIEDHIATHIPEPLISE